MALTPEQIAQTMHEWADSLTAPCPFVKADIRAAIVAADAWATANAASYNTALPQPFRGTASAADKAVLLALVCLRRANR